MMDRLLLIRRIFMDLAGFCSFRGLERIAMLVFMRGGLLMDCHRAMAGGFALMARCMRDNLGLDSKMGLGIRFQSRVMERMNMNK